MVALCATAMLLACQRQARQSASVALSDSVLLVIERVGGSRLAEYEHRARLEHNGQVASRLDLTFDTGGYGRTNLYRLADGQFLLLDAGASVLIYVPLPSLQPEMTRQRRGVFVGAFDTDSTGTWRFIPASERPERPVEYGGG